MGKKGRVLLFDHFDSFWTILLTVEQWSPTCAAWSCCENSCDTFLSFFRIRILENPDVR